MVSKKIAEIFKFMHANYDQNSSSFPNAMPTCRVDVEIQPSAGVSRPLTFYYPSTCVKNYLEPGKYPLPEFCQTALAALREANRRVMEKWGISCSGCIVLEHRLQQMIASEEFLKGEAHVLHVDVE